MRVILASDFTGLFEILIVMFGTMLSGGLSLLALVLACWKTTQAWSGPIAKLSLLAFACVFLALCSLLFWNTPRHGIPSAEYLWAPFLPPILAGLTLWLRSRK